MWLTAFAVVILLDFLLFFTSANFHFTFIAVCFSICPANWLIDRSTNDHITTAFYYLAISAWLTNPIEWTSCICANVVCQQSREDWYVVDMYFNCSLYTITKHEKVLMNWPLAIGPLLKKNVFQEFGRGMFAQIGFTYVVESTPVHRRINLTSRRNNWWYFPCTLLKLNCR